MHQPSTLFSTAPTAKRWYERINIWWILLIGAFAFLLLALTCGRSGYASYKVCDQAITIFHQRLDREQYDEIYENTTSEFRQAGNRTDQIAFFRSVHEKMGVFRGGHYLGFNFNINTKGTTFVLNYQSEFARGSARENFTWFVTNAEARLIGYHIDSDNFK